jgi:hypothetical protein
MFVKTQGINLFPQATTLAFATPARTSGLFGMQGVSGVGCGTSCISNIFQKMDTVQHKEPYTVDSTVDQITAACIGKRNTSNVLCTKTL